MMGDLTFVSYQDMSNRSRRTRSRKACSECRRKKRQGNGPEQDQPSPQQREESEEQSIQGSLRSDVPDSSQTTRFISDLNPEARLLDKTTTPNDAQEVAPMEIGVWVQPRRRSKCAPVTPSSPPKRCRRSHPLVSNIVPPETIKALSDIYFANLHPIIPLLDQEEYWQQLGQGTIPAPLVHVVCLLAAKDNAATQHLKLLLSKDAIVPVHEFCSHLHASLSAGLSRRTTLGKLTLIRIFGLLSLHQEGSEGMDESSNYIAQAMHSAQSLSLHLSRPNDADNELKRTFWCLWTLDRLNAVMNSRPCIMADIDIGVPDLTPGESGFVAFDVCFRITKTLNKIIFLYRPRKDPVSGWDTDFPGFEQVMDELHAWQLPSLTIATLHIFYLATAILSHRLKTITTLPSPTPARLRQQLSAIQAIRYMQDVNRLNALHPLPVIVYTASLALSVSYQQLRYSRLSSEQEDARNDFNSGCNILQELRRKWASADAMASLSHRISIVLDQLPSLDVLRINRSSTVERDNTLTGGQGAAEEVHSPSLADGPGRVSDVQATQPHLETMDLFSGMDDVSWMYLDAENPVSFDMFPPLNFDMPYTMSPL
ncbi:hypothetical protein BDV25DRAFT_172154 [Aspergillus avenaceus]|uniref:Xylanolytic transcriptional activator regulatory domain-containing protein n=1 Tax=Aspergillus avenaceus TaxID=36643 RepID=A0A5N6TW16_ASPAV|nr:hypothetical protein BDV25DRAFT_172154 [Aspergillus avenaceus]